MARPLSTIIRELREDRGWTQAEFAERINAASAKINAEAGRGVSANLNVDQTTISRWESGARPAPANARRAIAHAVGLTIDELDALWRADDYKRVDGDETGKNGIPVINRAPAGMVIDYSEHDTSGQGQGFTYIDREDVSDPLAFAVIVVGDSMEPSIREGDVVVFSPLHVPKPRAILRSGMTVFIRFSAESPQRGACCIARFKEIDGETMKFTKDNPKHKPLDVPAEHIVRLAAAVQLRRQSI